MRSANWIARRFGGVAVGILLLALGACGGHGHATVPAVDDGLWIANSGAHDVLEFAGKAFAFKNIHDSVPHLINASGAFTSPQDAAFD